MEDIPIMEFMDDRTTIAIHSDLTILPEGEHNVTFTVGGEAIETPLQVVRTLDKIDYIFAIGSVAYKTTIYPDGRTYNSVLDSSNTDFPQEYQTKGTWRYTSSR